MLSSLSFAAASIPFLSTHHPFKRASSCLSNPSKISVQFYLSIYIVMYNNFSKALFVVFLFYFLISIQKKKKEGSVDNPNACVHRLKPSHTRRQSDGFSWAEDDAENMLYPLTRCTQLAWDTVKSKYFNQSGRDYVCANLHCVLI